MKAESHSRVIPDHLFSAPPNAYVTRLVERVRSLAVDGRGDDARGRHLASLYALEWAYQHDLFDYRPSRDPARWLMLLLDVAGARAGLPPSTRLTMPFGRLMSEFERIDLTRVAQRTRVVVTDAVAVVYRAPPPLIERMTVAAVLHALGMSAYGNQRREKHPQGRQIRKVLRGSIDATWDDALADVERMRRPDAANVLAAIPPRFEVTARAVDAALRRVDEHLDDLPFAVFYALLTDARRGGRVWVPADRFVEGGSYDRATYEEAVGHVLNDARSRRQRYRRSCVLAELGLSAAFPRTIARLDRWLEQEAVPEFRLDLVGTRCLADGWYAWARSQSPSIQSRHEQLVAAFASRRARTEPLRR